MTPMERIEGLLLHVVQAVFVEGREVARQDALAAIRLAVEVAEAQRAMTEDWSDADRDRCFAAAAAWAKWAEENK